MGDLVSSVYYDGSRSTYVHTVTPSINNNFVLDTAFTVAGYTGVAGWSFSDADAAGGDGDDGDFFQVEGTQLGWVSTIGLPFTFGWNATSRFRFLRVHQAANPR